MWENCSDKAEHDRLMKAYPNEKVSPEEVLRLHEDYFARAKRRDPQVEKPPHYTFSKYEVIDVLEAWFPQDALMWQVGKYIARAKHKGKELQDLKKAKFYLDRKIKQLEQSNSDPQEDTPQTKIVPGESFPL